jgi:hypothetical protein
MPFWMSSVVIAVLGTAVLGQQAFAPDGATRLVAAMVPPWQEGGFRKAAATGLAVVDLRWRGHVLILDTGGDPAALARLRASGFWLLDATGVRGCGSAAGNPGEAA